MQRVLTVDPSKPFSPLLLDWLCDLTLGFLFCKEVVFKAASSSQVLLASLYSQYREKVTLLSPQGKDGGDLLQCPGEPPLHL